MIDEIKNAAIECLNNCEPVCPYCGNEFSDAWELEDCHEVDCDNCDKEYLIERNIEITYSTSKPERE